MAGWCALVYVRIKVAVKSHHEMWANVARNTSGGCMIDFELISGQCVSTRPRPIWTAEGNPSCHPQ